MLMTIIEVSFFFGYKKAVSWQLVWNFLLPPWRRPWIINLVKISRIVFWVSQISENVKAWKNVFYWAWVFLDISKKSSLQFFALVQPGNNLFLDLLPNPILVPFSWEWSVFCYYFLLYKWNLFDDSVAIWTVFIRKKFLLWNIA